MGQPPVCCPGSTIIVTPFDAFFLKLMPTSLCMHPLGAVSRFSQLSCIEDSADQLHTVSSDLSREPDAVMSLQPMVSKLLQ